MKVMNGILVAWLVGGSLLAQAPPMPPPPPEAPEAPRGGASRMERRTETLPMNGRLWVRNRNGAIRVSGWDREEVSLVADIRDSERRRVSLVTQRKDGGLDIDAQVEQPRWNFSFGFVVTPRCEMRLQVPKRLLGHFRTANGLVEVQGIQGYVRAEVVNGDVRIRDLEGEAHATTVNGDIEARRLKARIQGGTTNGGITLEQVEGGIRMETTNGSIKAAMLDGWGEGIRLETTNGSIEVELGRATGEIVAENSIGAIEARVPGAQVVEQTRHRAHLKVAGRPQRIALTTTNGAIRIRP